MIGLLLDFCERRPVAAACLGLLLAVIVVGSVENVPGTVTTTLWGF